MPVGTHSNWCALVLAGFASAAFAQSSPEAERLRAEADVALATGRYAEALATYERVLQLEPRDRHAHREAGRAAQAAGDYARAERELDEAHRLAPERADPELHLLRGELLYALGRPDEARAAHALARDQLPLAPVDPREVLWRARILARGGELDEAASLYAALAERMPRQRAEIYLAWADAYLLNDRLTDAEFVLHDLLSKEPSNVPARQVLAWVQEARGNTAGELKLRRELARDAPGPANEAALARALERAGDYRGARAAYLRARETAAGEERRNLEVAAEQMRLRASPEVAVSAGTLNDPSANAYSVTAGGGFRLGAQVAAAVAGFRRDSAGQGLEGEDTGVRMSLKLGRLPRPTLTLTGQARSVAVDMYAPETKRLVDGLQASATVELDLRPHRMLSISARADADTPWDESAATLSRGGTFSGVSATAWATPLGERVVFSAGGFLRALHLPPRQEWDPTPAARLLFFQAGVDGVAWVDYGSRVRGQVLDETLTRETDFADSLVVSLRHYEVSSAQNASFTSWLSLAERATINEASLTARKALWGLLGVEATGGVGYDHVRELLLMRAGAGVTYAPSRSTRLAAHYAFASESQIGLEGRRQSAGVTFHVDF